MRADQRGLTRRVCWTYGDCWAAWGTLTDFRDGFDCLPLGDNAQGFRGGRIA